MTRLGKVAEADLEPVHQVRGGHPTGPILGRLALGFAVAGALVAVMLALEGLSWM